MDAPRDAATTELRRCYLKASVLVHPDKNHHPQATRAFQRVAAAWAILSDAQKRRDYDQELLDGEQSDEVHMSPEEAFAAFAFAAACGGTAGFGDMAETLPLDRSEAMKRGETAQVLGAAAWFGQANAQGQRCGRSALEDLHLWLASYKSTGSACRPRRS